MPNICSIQVRHKREGSEDEWPDHMVDTKMGDCLASTFFQFGRNIGQNRQICLLNCNLKTKTQMAGNILLYH